jgi:regulator of sigma E protease
MTSLFFFLVALAILVVVHEFGHFWVAKKCGVKVLTFSVGFGPKIWSKLGRDGTEYVVASIPLGGYVKMLDEREGNVDQTELNKAFNRQPLRSKVMIVSAGPIANLIFAVMAYWLIFMLGIPGVKPIVGNVVEESPAMIAGMAAYDHIIAVEGKETATWKAVIKALSLRADENSIEIETISSGIRKQIEIKTDRVSQATQQSELAKLGISPLKIALKPVLGDVLVDSPAERAGLQKGDIFSAHNQQSINDWNDWVELIQNSPEKTLEITVIRDDKALEFKLTPDKSEEGKGLIGVKVDTSATEIPAELLSKTQYGVVKSFLKAIDETWQYSVLTITSVGGMLAGSISTENIGGPLSIAQYAGASANQGVVSFIGFLAVISISLGILNLLPIPILDGGHLIMYLVEWLRGQPLSESVIQTSQKVGLFMLMLLMYVAFYNDLTRLFG